MICPNCGTEGSGAFCTKCGAQLSFDTNTAGNTQPQYQPVYQPCTSVSEEQLPEKFKPISPWAYFGLQLLFSIPLIGFIFLIVFSCSNENINRRNFARSYWCVLALSVIIFVVTLVIAAVAGAAAYGGYYY